MSVDNLVSLKKMQNDIKTMKLLGFLLKPEQRKQLRDVEQNISNILKQTQDFNNRFSPHGWCAYDSMNLPLMEQANAAFDEQGLDAAEQILISYYKSDVKGIIQKIKYSSEAFTVRDELIQKFFDDHFAGRYHASVPLGLIIVDGAVNDFTKSKGFFAEGTSVDAWDCLVGCSDGLKKLKEIFNQNRTKTNTDVITLPYRNGILHGRDLNYANEYVSCKCVALMFAVSDWMKMKNSEEQRKAEYEKATNPPPIKESLARIQESKQTRKEISNWKPRTVVIGQDIPATGSSADYQDYPYIVKIVEMLDAWKNRNYGKLSTDLKRMFSFVSSERKRAGECRKFFENKMFDTFEIIEVEERACALSKIVVKVCWITQNNSKEAKLTFGCVYENTGTSISVPWKNNGEWVIVPWDIRELYQ